MYLCPWCNKSDTFIKHYKLPLVKKDCDKQIGLFIFNGKEMELEATGYREGAKLLNNYYCELCMKPVDDKLNKIIEHRN